MEQAEWGGVNRKLSRRNGAGGFMDSVTHSTLCQLRLQIVPSAVGSRRKGKFYIRVKKEIPP